MSHGYCGKVAKVNLNEGKFSVENPAPSIYRTYLGGRGLSLYYLLRQVPAGLDGFAPENLLVFSAGLVTGAPVPAFPRYTVAAVSPLSGGMGASEAGGFWGPELKFAGFDALIINGRAERPVYLWVHDGEVEIREAGHLWGKSTGDTLRMILAELDDPGVRVAVIGPAGEKLVRYACILNGLRNANGRMGLGAVMGSKNLKAVAVRGLSRIEPADPETLRAVALRFARSVKKNVLGYELQEYGSTAGIAALQTLGMLPTKNFSGGAFDQWEKISGEAIKVLQTGRHGCFACPVKCKKSVALQSGRYDLEPGYGAPEYETVAAFGSNCLIADLEALCKAHELCNKLGLDTISTGVMVSFAMECFEKGLLTERDTGGLPIRFGDPDTMLSLIQMIAERTGIGNLLAEGSARAAEIIGGGAEEFACNAKKVEWPMHDPRAKYALGIGYAVGGIGADHMSSPHDTFYVQSESLASRGLQQLGFYEPVALLGHGLEKVRMYAVGQSLWSSFNSLGACIFGIAPRGVMPLEDFVAAVRAASGFDTSLYDLMTAGERADIMSRVFNLRQGLTAADDTLSSRAFGGLETGKLKGVRITREELQKSISSYYRTMGWDDKNGIPYPETLERLGISWLDHLI